ncbi:hypothetical protein ACWDGI_00560 [Streptomyces sp. NPDC001220]
MKRRPCPVAAALAVTTAARLTACAGTTTDLRSSRDGTLELQATIREVSWTASGSPGGDLPGGSFGTAQDVTVQAVQAVNR